MVLKEEVQGSGLGHSGFRVFGEVKCDLFEMGRMEYVFEQRFYFFLFFGKVNSKSEFNENSFEKMN
ncbi:MAG: hypothetical protein ACFFB0_17920 [Promethearchaeota archaeon]